MNKSRFVFVGNRRFVLQAMLKKNLFIEDILVVRDTHLHRDIENGSIPGVSTYTVISEKSALMQRLGALRYDVLVSNGCPFILPIEKLPEAKYVNIHPSCLPDLRGVDPVIGSILYARDGGATCHVMDSGIDTGPIISQILIPYTRDLDVSTLYQLSFIAEQEAFSKAYELSFVPQSEQVSSPDDIYYNRRREDMIINFREQNDSLVRKIKAFNNRSIGCEFIHDGVKYKVYGVVKIENPFLKEIADKQPEGTILLSYENSIVFKKDGEVLRLLDVKPESGSGLTAGTRLFVS